VTPVHPSSATVLLAEEEEERASGSITVEFARSAKKAMTDGAIPLLDLAEHHDLDIGYGCRAGSCGDCKVRVLSGRVEMESEEGLHPDEKAAGYVLTCVGRPVKRLSSTLANSRGVGERIRHAVPDWAWNFDSVPARSWHERNLMAPYFAAYCRSVRKVDYWLQSFLSMRRIEARRKNAKALRVRFSNSLASRRHRLSQVKVRSTTQRWGEPRSLWRDLAVWQFRFRDAEALWPKPFERPALISAIGEELLQKRIHAEQGRDNEHASVAVLNIGRMHDRIKQEP
jgi:ferredoxin